MSISPEQMQVEQDFTGIDLELLQWGACKTATKADLAQKAAIVIAETHDGIHDPLDLLILLNKVEKLSELIKDGIKKLAFDKTPLGIGEVYNKFGCAIERGVFGVKYNYANTGDPIWRDLEIGKKEREAFLKTIVLPSSVAESEREAYTASITVDVIDKETGEVTGTRVLNPPIKTGTEGLKCSVK